MDGLCNSFSAYNRYYSSFRDIELIKKDIIEHHDKNLVLVRGGEPTFHPDFQEIMKLLTDFKKVIIVTNGSIFHDIKSVEIASQFKNIIFAVEIFAYTASVHDKVSKVEGSFMQTTYGMMNLINKGLKVAAIIPLLTSNLTYITPTINFLYSMNITSITLFYPNIIEKNLIPRYSDARGYLLEAIEKSNNLVNIENVPDCFIKYNEDHLTHVLFSNERIQADTCKRCNHQNSCQGLDKTYAKIYGFDELTPYGHSKIEPITFYEKLKSISSELKQEHLMLISEDEIMQLINVIKEKNSMWDAIHYSGCPIPLFISIIEKLSEYKILEVKDNGLLLISTNPSWNQPKNFSNLRLESDPSKTQLLVAFEDILKRINYICSHTCPGKKIAVIGDDDFVSLSLASTGHFSQVISFEIDQRIVDKVNEIAQKNKYNLKSIKHDVRKCFTQEYLNQFDMFYTDPPYTVEGLSLFVSRGVQLLKPYAKLSGFVSFTPEHPTMEIVEIPAQEKINDMSLFVYKKSNGGKNTIPALLKEKFPNLLSLKEELKKDVFDIEHRWYLAALGREEAMMHLLTTYYTRPLIIDDFYEEIYYDFEPLMFYSDDFLKEKLRLNNSFFR